VNGTSISRSRSRIFELGTSFAPLPRNPFQDFIVPKSAKQRSTLTPNSRFLEFCSGSRLSKLSGTRGQSVLEFALVLPIMLLLLIGVIEVGRFAYFSILVANAARAGAQYGAQGLATAADTPGIQAAAENDGQNLPQLTVTASQACGCNGAGLSGTCPATGCTLPNHPLVYVQVQASGTFNSLFNYPGLPPSFTVSSTEKMRVAQ
jgi:Flp pilus assembly protein TadG